jgi:hypothetical protein
MRSNFELKSRTQHDMARRKVTKRNVVTQLKETLITMRKTPRYFETRTRTRRKSVLEKNPDPNSKKNPDSCLKKPGLDFWKPGLEIEKTGLKTRTLCTRMERFLQRFNIKKKIFLLRSFLQAILKTLLSLVVVLAVVKIRPSTFLYDPRLFHMTLDFYMTLDFFMTLDFLPSPSTFYPHPRHWTLEPGQKPKLDSNGRCNDGHKKVEGCIFMTTNY